MAYENDILTRNDNDELAVRTVQSVGDNPASSYDDVYTRDNNGKLAVRVVGSGGGDSHNKGYFATQAELEEAYPTGEAGDYAIVGSTDTVWIWDDDNDEWKDTDQKGQVESVNGQTGTVVLTASDVGALENTATGEDSLTIGGSPTTFFGAVNVGKYSQANNVGGVAAGCNAKTYGFAGVAVGSAASSNAAYAVQIGGDNQINFDANTVKFGNANGNFEMMSADGTIPSDRLTHAIRKLSTMPTASAGYLGQTVLFDGTTDSTYTHGYIYECKAQGTNPETYAWEQLDVQPSSGGTQYNYTAELEFEPGGETFGRIVVKGQQNKCSTVYVRMSIADYYDDSNEWGEAYSDNEYLGILQPTQQSDIKGASTIIALRPYQTILVEGGSGEENGLPFITFDLNYAQSDWAESKTKFIFEISCNEQLEVVTTRDSDDYHPENVGKNVMCVPTPIYDPNSTDARYLVDRSGSQQWEQIPQSEGLPSQTGQSGKFLTTDGTGASWGTTVEDNTLVIKNSQTSMYGGYPNQITLYSKYNGSDGTGVSIKSGNNGSMALNASSISTTGGIYPSSLVALNLGLDTSSGTWNTVYAKSLGNRSSSNVIRIPEATAGVLAVQVSTMPTADSTRVGQMYQYVGTTDSTYTHGHLYECVSDGADPATYSWTEVQLGGGGSTSATATLSEMNWVNNSQTVNVQGVTANNNVIVSAAPASQTVYSACGIVCSAQGAGTLTFTCDSVPTTGVTVNVLII